MSDVTRVQVEIEQDGPEAAEKLLPQVYDELRKLAAVKLAEEKPGQTIQATALVHEAYIRLIAGHNQRWNNLGHFFGAAAEAMRRILIENARRKSRLKRGGGRQRLDLESAEFAFNTAPADLLELDDLIVRLAADDPQAAEVVKLRLFAGLSIEQAAGSLGISRSLAFDHWAYARAWLTCELQNGASASPEMG